MAHTQATTQQTKILRRSSIIRRMSTMHHVIVRIVISKIDENRCKQIVASLPNFGRAGSQSLQLY